MTAVDPAIAARARLQAERIDPIWRGQDPEVHAKVRVHRFLATMLGQEPDDFGVGRMSIEECREAWKLLRGVTYEHVDFWAKHGTAKYRERMQPA